MNMWETVACDGLLFEIHAISPVRLTAIEGGRGKRQSINLGASE
jgi:hypothetical protein